MVSREFVTHSEASRLLGDAEAVRQSMLAHELHAYVELANVEGPWFRGSASSGSNAPVSGKTRLASWFKHLPLRHPDATEEAPSYTLSGWFMLDPLSTESLARRGNVSGGWVVLVPEHNDESDTEKYVSYEDAGFSPNVDLHMRDLWFRISDIERLASGAPVAKANDEVLDPRERTALLCIIGALAAHADVDLSQPFKAGDTIAAMMPGVKLSGRTIGEHLKAVREAMDSRKG